MGLNKQRKLYRQYDKMKRHIYNKVISVAMLASGLAFTACQDDDFVQYTAFEVGEEIRFCASAAQDGSATTRTVYGATGTKEGLDYIALNWEVGDKIEIVSPQAALSGGTGKAVYAIDDPNISEGFAGNDTEGHSNASMLKKESESGLQWGVGYTKDVDENGAIDAKLEEGWHDFYALYPSSNSFTSEDEGQILLDLLQVNDEVRPTATGYMPIVQKPNVKKGDGDGISKVESEGKTTYTVHPDMRYAYMVATTQTSRYKEVNEEDPPIQLQFKPITTALQFEITADEISVTNGSELTITSIQLTTAPNVLKNICGYFTCDYLSGQMYAQNDEATYNRIYLDLSGATEPITLKQGDKCDVTFFVLPTQDFNAGDLQLQIFFTLKGSPQVRTATINRPLYKMKKYHFKNLLMPKFDTKVSGSSWWQALDPNTLASQVSIPVASNVFASKQYFSKDTYTNYLQQVKSYTDLWDMGVRGFEFVNRKSGYNVQLANQPTRSLADAHFVVDENPLETDTINFGKAFNTLAGKLSENPNECLVLICTYQAIADGYNPNYYVQQLLNYLDDFVADNDYGYTKDDFIQINAGTTVGDLKSNIAIVIRPGDDDRYESNSTTASISLTSNDGSTQTDWSGNVTLIQDWGTAFDVWDRRYNGVAREAQFETQYRKTYKPDLEQRPLMEDWLWGAGAGTSGDFVEYNNNGTTDDGNNAFDNFGSDVKDKPEPLATFNYAHPRANGGTAYVQEWARVVPSTMAKPIYTGLNNEGVYLWVQWDESYSEKQKAIDGLFKLSVAEKGKTSDNLYINSLSGYYVDEDIKDGLYPFKNSYAVQYYGRGGLFDWEQKWRSATISAKDMGKGGDHVTLAYNLNKYVYSILSGDSVMSSTSKKLDEGPWGLVMMEHIGNTAKGTDDKSIDLVNLIMMNNFKFPLMVAPDDDNTGGGNTPNTPATTDAAVSFSNEPANPSGEIH